MRKRGEGKELTVHAIAGSHVVLLGMNIANKKALKGFRGFAIERTDHTEGETKWLTNFKRFASQMHDSTSYGNPIQEFVWGDYTAKEDHKYTYRVVARYGEPGNLTDGDSAKVTVRTENAKDATHSVYFNRGIGASQAYATRYYNLPPEEARARIEEENKTAKKKKEDPYVWLSRGLSEALLEFIGKAKGPRYALRASLYEFHYDPVVDAFAEAAQRGVDVKIVFDAKNNESGPNAKVKTDAFPRLANLASIVKAKLEIGKQAFKRESGKSAISHNKFIILLRDGKPLEVWTGSTNISEGGIYGHSNVGHLVRDPEVAKKYLQYWEAIAADPDAKEFRSWNDTSFPVPDSKTTPLVATVFSPRGSIAALEAYADWMDQAKSSVFLTAAFGVSKQLSAVLDKPKKYLRYVLLEKSDDNTTTLMKRDKANRFAVGSIVRKNALEFWVEKLTGLNKNVKFIHTKYMLIDPLSENPTVITGSANFSEPSTNKNDENMLIIRGDTRVADIYLGEFMRLFNHYEFRQHIGSKAEESLMLEESPGVPGLRNDDGWWQRFYEAGSARERERKLFA